MSYVFAFAVGASLTGCLVWAVARWRGFRLPPGDLALIVGLSSGLALLPSVGWLLGMVIMSLLLLRTTDADTWPDAVVAVAGSGVVWLIVDLLIAWG